MNTTSNSKIFTSTIFGLSSGDTAAKLIQKVVNTQEEHLRYSTASSLGTQFVNVPSNQKKLSDKKGN